MPRTRFFRILCDGCKDGKLDLEPINVVNLIPPWRVVEVPSWGEFHACSDQCEAEIRARYERPEAPIMIESEFPPREDPTIPDMPSTMQRAVVIKRGRNGKDKEIKG